MNTLRTRSKVTDTYENHASTIRQRKIKSSHFPALNKDKDKEDHRDGTNLLRLLSSSSFFSRLAKSVSR